MSRTRRHWSKNSSYWRTTRSIAKLSRDHCAATLPSIRFDILGGPRELLHGAAAVAGDAVQVRLGKTPQSLVMTGTPESIASTCVDPNGST